ncbi:hypothetical protein [Haloferula sp. A504]|uniref:hypothetical protein n=1 Tax=Haloferula sp. A504 TaxID=3373601 RepID=UPI0031C57861|nr:hypothetical protein [Verrucomicrobiaceae bacterium E54]
MRGLWAILLPTFALGFGVAWWLKPEPERVETEADRPKVVPRAPGAESGLQEVVITPQTKLDGLAELWFENSLDEGLAAIAPEAIPELLAALEERVGYYGLSDGDEKVFEKLVLRWYDADPKAALLWVLALPAEDDRRMLIASLIEREAERDFASAYKLAVEYGNEADGFLRMADTLFRRAAEIGAREVIDVSLLSRTSATTTYGHDLEYPPGFDFRAALDGLADAQAALDEGECLSSVPANLLVEWAKRDPGAAYAWLQTDRVTPFGDDFSSFIRGYGQAAKPKDLGAFAAQVFTSSPSAAVGYQKVFQILGEAPSLEVVEGFLGASGDPAQRVQHLAGLFKQAESGHGSLDEGARELVLRATPPELRLQWLAASSMSVEARITLVPLLRSLGHSDGEIAVMTGATGR